jgi:PhnB protein
MSVQTYLQFNGRCEEALAYYRETLGAEVMEIIRFKDVPEAAAGAPAGTEDKVLHACFRVAGTHLMASDGMCGGDAAFAGFSLTLTSSTDEETERLFTSIAREGNVVMPLSPSFFSSQFGVVTDRYGLSWTFVTQPAVAPAEVA